MTQAKSIILSLRNSVATITFNDEATLNALTEKMLVDFHNILCEMEENQDVKVIILTGAGGNFCAGANLASDMLERNGDGFSDWLEKVANPIATKIRSMQKPVIAAVKGAAAGAGFSLALACDFILAGESAKFILSFAKIGAALDMGASWTLIRTIGTLRANALAMLAQPIDGKKAKEWGIVHDIFTDIELMEQAQKLAERLIAGSSAPALGLIKEQLNRAAVSTLKDALTFEAQVQGKLILTEETQQLISAFRNR